MFLFLSWRKWGFVSLKNLQSVHPLSCILRLFVVSLFFFCLSFSVTLLSLSSLVFSAHPSLSLVTSLPLPCSLSLSLSLSHTHTHTLSLSLSLCQHVSILVCVYASLSLYLSLCVSPQPPSLSLSFAFFLLVSLVAASFVHFSSVVHCCVMPLMTKLFFDPSSIYFYITVCV